MSTEEVLTEVAAPAVNDVTVSTVNEGGETTPQAPVVVEPVRNPGLISPGFKLRALLWILCFTASNFVNISITLAFGLVSYHTGLSGMIFRGFVAVVKWYLEPPKTIYVAPQIVEELGGQLGRYLKRVGDKLGIKFPDISFLCEWIEVIIFFLFLVFFIWSLWVLLRKLGKEKLKNAIIRWRMRTKNITYEAHVPGSEYTPGPMPEMQVQILAVGVLTETHVGFGLRLGSTLVLPQHVIDTVYQLTSSYRVLLRGKTGSVVVDLTNRSTSDVVTDLAYVQLMSNIWSSLGTVSLKRRELNPEKPVVVNAHGVKGFSVGALRQSPYTGIVYYGGSTEPGMSGCGYFINGVCYGMHLGVTSGTNMGIFSTVFFGEVPIEIENEDSPHNNKGASFTPPKAEYSEKWNNQSVVDLINKKGRKAQGKRWRGESTGITVPTVALGDDPRKSYLDLLKGMTPGNRAIMRDCLAAMDTIASVERITGDVISVVGHSPVLPKFDMSVGGDSTGQTALDVIVLDNKSRILTLERTFTALENGLKQVEESIKKFGTHEEIQDMKRYLDELGRETQQVAADACFLTPNSMGAFQCEMCREMFPTLKALILHREVKHDYKKNYNKIRNDGSCSIAAGAWYDPTKQRVAGQHSRKIREIGCDECDRKFKDEAGIEQHKIDAHKEKRVRFACDGCSRSFQTEPGLEDHKKTHPQNVVNESFDEDNKTFGVRTDKTSFLGQHRPSQKPKLRKSKSTSSMWDVKNHFQSLAETQYETQRLMQNMSKSLNDLVKTMTGQASGTTRN